MFVCPWAFNWLPFQQKFILRSTVKFRTVQFRRKRFSGDNGRLSGSSLRDDGVRDFTRFSYLQGRFDRFSTWWVFVKSIVRSFSLSVSSEMDLKSSSSWYEWPVSGHRGSPDVGGDDSSGGGRISSGAGTSMGGVVSLLLSMFACTGFSVWALSVSRVQEKGQEWALWSGDLQKLQSSCSGHSEARWPVWSQL